MPARAAGEPSSGLMIMISRFSSWRIRMPTPTKLPSICCLKRRRRSGQMISEYGSSKRRAITLTAPSPNSCSSAVSGMATVDSLAFRIEFMTSR